MDLTLVCQAFTQVNCFHKLEGLWWRVGLNKWFFLYVYYVSFQISKTCLALSTTRCKKKIAS